MDWSFNAPPLFSSVIDMYISGLREFPQKLAKCPKNYPKRGKIPSQKGIFWYFFAIVFNINYYCEGW